MANSNQVELVVTVEVDKANSSIKSVNANLSGIEQTAVRAARGASQGIDGMTASMVKGATAGNLLADAIKKAIEFAKEWTVEAAKEAAQAERAAAVTMGLAKAHGDSAAAASKAVEAVRAVGFIAADATVAVQKLIIGMTVKKHSCSGGDHEYVLKCGGTTDMGAAPTCADECGGAMSGAMGPCP